MRNLTVGLGSRSYPILIAPGLLAGLGHDLAERRIAKRYFVIADDRVAGLFGDALLRSLAAASLPAELITFPAGEESKHLATVATLASELARRGADRKDGLIALGGGVTGDITGFLAAIYMRGIPFVQIPTTLLAQVDSSVGGKTGADIPEGKNLVGCFYQPKAVYIDTDVLKSLPREELLNGIAEVIKYGVIRDYGFFALLEEKREEILALDQEVMETVIERCCAIKAEVVAVDEREGDLRRILNFGHTLGHAVEGASGYRLAHGTAVAMGMAAVAAIAVEKGVFSQDEASRLARLITAFGLPVAIPADLARPEIKSYLKTDKKTVGGRVFFVLPTAIGKVTITDGVTEGEIDRALAS